MIHSKRQQTEKKAVKTMTPTQIAVTTVLLGDGGPVVLLDGDIGSDDSSVTGAAVEEVSGGVHGIG